MQKRSLPILLLLLAVGCGGGEETRITSVLPLSGDFQSYGESIRNGVDLAAAELAQRGDLPTELTFEVVDSESDPERAAELLTEAFGGGVYAAIGGVTTEEALAMVPVADRFNRVLVSPSASSPQLSGISRNFYRVFPSDKHEGGTMATFAALKLQLAKAVIVAKEETYARGVQEIFAAEFERNGGEVLELIEYPPGGADFSGLLERVVALEPDVVYLAAFADDVSAMIAALRELGYSGRIVTTSAFSSPAAIEQLGDDAEEVLLTQAVFDASSEDPAIRSFVERYEAEHGFAPDLWAAHGYDAMMTIAKALEDGRVPASEFWKNVRGLRDFTGVTGTIQFNEKGDVQKYPRVYGVVAGELVDYERHLEEKKQELMDRMRRLREDMRQRGQAGG